MKNILKEYFINNPTFYVLYFLLGRFYMFHFS